MWSSNGVTWVFLKPKLSKFDLFFDPWPLTFWPMTSPFGDLLAITKTHIGYKFHQDPPMGTWWKVVDNYLTDWLTHWLTHRTTSMGERCHSKTREKKDLQVFFRIGLLIRKLPSFLSLSTMYYVCNEPHRLSFAPFDINYNLHARVLW